MHAQSTIAVAGGTGRVGRHVVELMQERGHRVVPIARSTGVDVITGEGLRDALAGVDTIIDAATGPSPDQEAATAFFTTAARNLQEAGREAGVGRLVVVSIIGIDRYRGGYQAAKRAQEQAARDGAIPARILRAAQFHEFVGELVNWGRQGDVVHLPRMRTQLVAARAVAEELVALATGPDAAFTGPSASAPTIDVAGPRAEQLVDVATLLLARRGEAVRVEGVSNPDEPDARLHEEGALLPGPGAILTGPTFAEWLDATS